MSALPLDVAGYQRTVSLQDLTALCATPLGDVYVLMGVSRLIKRIFNGWASVAAGSSKLSGHVSVDLFLNGIRAHGCAVVA